jgi:hypothetical protein
MVPRKKKAEQITKFKMKIGSAVQSREKIRTCRRFSVDKASFLNFEYCGLMLWSQSPITG